MADRLVAISYRLVAIAFSKMQVSGCMPVWVVLNLVKLLRLCVGAHQDTV